MAISGHFFRLSLFLGFLALSLLVPAGLAQAQADQETIQTEAEPRQMPHFGASGPGK
jgi:hypothetical protein